MTGGGIESGATRRGGMTRRRALGLAGAAGAAYVAGPLRPLGAGGDAAAPAEAEAASSCVLAPEVTEGPYWVDVREKRSDVVAGQSGAPLTLDLYVYRSDDSCEPEPGAVVDIWHCNASGLYSDEAANGTSGQTWLRGYQETDAAGHVRFTTIYPGWYAGRTVHIHVRVRTFSGPSTTYDFTTQIFFAEEDSAAVFATSPYDSRSGRDTTNAEDMIYQQEARAGNVLMPTLSGSPSAGYTGTVGIGLSGLPASSSSGSGSGSGGSSSSSGDAKVDASLLSRRFIHAGDRRELLLGLRAGERIAAEAKLMRGGRAVAHKKIAALAPGRRNMAVPIAAATPAGAARLRLELTDRAGNSHTIHRRVQIPAG
ncbi:MAG TPA: intradiol ring-cleavage dioxygenase [Solirubrobacterales bacterium]|nr:intradiol ring-cleavage dioxygenase [Solirubrobacterales bacterium]